MSKFDEDLSKKLKKISVSFEEGQLNGALTIINRLMDENREHQYDHKELIGAINTIGDELRDNKVIGVQK